MIGLAPILLDLYCKAGGAARGYAEAGWHVVGVDIEPQPHYPYNFVLSDALDFVVRHGRQFDAIHASPPCYDHSDLGSFTPDTGTAWLLAATRAALTSTRRPYVIENVEGAPMIAPLVLCGTEFGLGVDTDRGRRHLARHRLFESNVPLWGAGGCSCGGKRGRIIGVYGTGDGGTGRGWKGNITQRRAAMGIDWMTRNELANAIPPAYTRFIGEQLLDAIGHQRLAV